MTTTNLELESEDPMVILPANAQDGTQVAQVDRLPELGAEETGAERRARFASVMAFIRAAEAANFMAPNISDAELDDRISRARQAYRQTAKPSTTM
jgi:hypothetical protein